MATKIDADRALAHHGDAIIAHPNVSKISVIDAGNGEFQLEIGLVRSEEAAAAVLKNFGPLPDELQIPDPAGRLGKATIAVTKTVVGPLVAKRAQARLARPVAGGCYCGPVALDLCGTLGAMVDKGGTANILSSWHVLYGKTGKDGMAIVQPSKLQGGTDPADTIAYNKAAALTEHVDAAIAEVRKPAGDYVTAGTACFGGFSGTGAASKGQKVRICGGTSGAVSGTVKSTNATAKFTSPIYPNGEWIFKDQIEMNEFTLGGDSGSIIQSEKNEALGLLVGGGGGLDYANKIEHVLKAFGITIA
jgi:hypothetical protein